MEHTSNVYEFVGISEVAETTTHLLALALKHAQLRSSQQEGLSDVEHYVLQQARDYLATVREGFVISVRTSDVTQRSEIRYLLDRVLTDWDRLSQELGLDGVDEALDTEPVHPESVRSTTGPKEKARQEGRQAEVERVRRQLLAFGMAAIALGYLPRLPSKQVTFPRNYGKPPTYSDIPVPRTAGEMLWRIEELEETVWQFMSHDLGELVQSRYGPVRRTYGFFETSAWLSVREVQRFGLKTAKTQVRRF